MIRLYEAVFNSKIDSFQDHPMYSRLREQANIAIRNHTGFGLESIRAGSFMDRIIKMPNDYIVKWLDGKNGLQWIDQETGINYDSEPLIDALNRQSR